MTGVLLGVVVGIVLIVVFAGFISAGASDPFR
jgi:hypothetical protein